MTPVEKVTVSLPAELMAHIEGQRQERGANRSEVVTDLLWRGWRQLEGERREERYRAAFSAQPETIGEFEWAEMAADELLAEHNDARTDPDSTSETPRRAAS